MLEDLESNAVKYYRDVEGEGPPDDGSEGGGYSPSLGPEEEEPLLGGDSPLEAEPSPLAPIAEEPDAPMDEVPQDQVQPAAVQRSAQQSLLWVMLHQMAPHYPSAAWVRRTHFRTDA